MRVFDTSFQGPFRRVPGTLVYGSIDRNEVDQSLLPWYTWIAPGRSSHTSSLTISTSPDDLHLKESKLQSQRQQTKGSGRIHSHNKNGRNED